MFYMKGKVTRQAHVDIPEGTVEEEYGRAGFAGRYAHLYRTRPPVEWTAIEGDLRPWAVRAQELPGLGEGDYLSGRVTFAWNEDVALHMSHIDEAMPYCFRNGDGDEVLFVHVGAGRIETDFGPLRYERGDYLVIPRGTVYRLLPDEATRLLVIETRGEVDLPPKGILGQHALFDPAVINVPEPAPVEDDGRSEWQLKVQRRGRLTTITYPYHPINVVGWKGDLTVWQLNVRDIRPVLSDRYHLPPTAHATFMANNVVICTFLPRPLETGDPKALKVPFYHSNIDYDEVLFYHDGDFFSREGIAPGMVTIHPAGLPHGAQPGAVKAAEGKTRTLEQAVMIDTVNPLTVTEKAQMTAWTDYWTSWQPK